jgi:hypothetical protein
MALLKVAPGSPGTCLVFLFGCFFFFFGFFHSMPAPLLSDQKENMNVFAEY